MRFACHLNEVKIVPICNKLNKRNIITAINLMQISEIKDKEIEDVLKFLSKSKLDLFYFADSLGNLEPHNIIHLANLIKKLEKRYRFSCS